MEETKTNKDERTQEQLPTNPWGKYSVQSEQYEQTNRNRLGLKFQFDCQTIRDGDGVTRPLSRAIRVF